MSLDVLRAAAGKRKHTEKFVTFIVIIRVGPTEWLEGNLQQILPQETSLNFHVSQISLSKITATKYFHAAV
jgi:hypothetical protein